MTVDRIIEQLDGFQAGLFIRTKGGIEPAPPEVLSSNLLLIRGLLVQLVDKVAETEQDYRRTKAARFDKFLKDGIKKSPAMDMLEMEPDLIEKKLATERLKNYLKYVDGLCTSVQSVLRVQTGSDKNQY